MRKLVIALAVTLLASSSLMAGRSKLPPQFVGAWCLDNPENEKEAPAYRLGRCLPHHQDSDGWLTVSADGFIGHETRCSVVRSAPDEKSNYLVKFRCSGEGETWTRNFWMSLQLVMSETEREP
jgi:hypothetical protein